MKVSDVKASLSRADLKVQILARPSIDLIGGQRFQRRFRAGDRGL
jgi:hypothetical protein